SSASKPATSKPAKTTTTRVASASAAKSPATHERPTPAIVPASAQRAVQNSQRKQQPQSAKAAKNQNQKDEWNQIRESARVLPTGHRWRNRQLIAQRHMSIRSNHLRHLPHRAKDRSVVILRPQRRNHRASKVPDLRVVQNPLKPVSHVDPVLVIVHRQKHQHAAVRPFLAHFPF